MGYCHKCGSELPEDSEFCPKCGTKLVTTTSQAPSATQASPTPAAKGSGNASLGRKLILAGGIIAMIFSIWLLILSTFWTTLIQIMLVQMTGLPMSFLSYMWFFMFVGSFIGIATGLFAIYMASTMRKRTSKNGSIAVIVTGVAILFSGNVLSAVLIIAGGLLSLQGT